LFDNTTVLSLNGSSVLPLGAGAIDLGSINTFFDGIFGNTMGLKDGVTAPATATGFANLYVDTADGDLKVKFADGTVKTIATDT